MTREDKDMGKVWDYAELSKLAKKFDGPKNMIEALQKSSYLKGFKAGKAAESPKKLLYGALGALAGAAALKIYEHFSKTEEPDNSDELSAEERAAIEQELVSGIEQYDAETGGGEADTDSEDAAFTGTENCSDTTEKSPDDNSDQEETV
jgi:hypothetical protein